MGTPGLMIAFGLPIILPVFRFPPPGGPYPIGTLTYHWVDIDREEVFTPDPSDRRELMVQIYYPAQADPLARRTPYLPDVNSLTRFFASIHQQPEWLLGNLKYITTNAMVSSPVSEDQLTYPVLIFLEGLSGFRQMNTFQTEELVSQGYIVVASDQPYVAAQVSFPDGHRVAMLPLAQLKPLVRQSYLPAQIVPLLNPQISRVK